MVKKLQVDRLFFLSLSIGIAYLWFGILKFFPEISPAEDVAGETISLLTFHLIPNNVSVFILAVWETVLGVFLILNLRYRIVILLAITHIIFTFTPLFLMSESCFNRHFYALSLLGQYILKNLIILSALVVLLPKKEKEKNRSPQTSETSNSTV